MKHYNYLIVGGGMTADAAARGIRKIDPDGSIGMFSLEPDEPYTRPLLSKGLWKGKTIDKAMRRTDQFNVDFKLRSRVTALDPDHKQVTDRDGNLYSYDKLLLATGGKPRRLPFGGEDILYYRTLEDYRRLRLMADQKNRFAVVGGGFIGSEIAAALAMNGKQVTMIFPEDGIGARMFPGDLSLFLNDYYRQKGVDVCPNATVSGLERQDDELLVKVKGGKEVPVDGVVAGLGIMPSYELAQNAGLDVKNGILVDEYLRTSQPDIYAAGDVAEFYNPALGKKTRVEHEDNANTMGQTAGINMAASLKHGEMQLYHHLPFFYSDLFDLGYEAVGELNSQLEMVADWKEPFQKGVVYYLQNQRVRGVLLWNVWNQVPAARELIAEEGPIQPRDLINRIPA